ncbi:hypothetical protein ACSSS7_000785 [Eimeria intestinalis]
MESAAWQQQRHQELLSTFTSGAFPMTDVPMKGVILANRKTIFHKTRVCPRLVMGTCHLGSKCSFAHSIEELRPAPNLDKTKLCPSVLHPGTPCPGRLRGEGCRFAHSKAEIRHTTNMYKTNMCLKWMRGKCKKELQCNHAHGHQELKYYRSLAMASGARDFARESLAGTARRKKSFLGSSLSSTLANLPALFANRQQLQKQTAADTQFQRNGSVSPEALLHLLGRSSELQLLQQQLLLHQQLLQQQNSNCTSVDEKALVALCDKLVRQATDMQGAPLEGKNLSFPNYDDSTSAADELSDFSSFSSLSSGTLSDAFLSAASTGASRMHGPELGLGHSGLLGAGGPAKGSSFNSSWEASSEAERLLLLKVWGGEDGDKTSSHRLVSRSSGDEEKVETQLSEVLSPADFTQKKSFQELSCMKSTTETAAAAAEWGALEASLATLCLADPGVEAPPGFEAKVLQRQQEQQEQQQQEEDEDVCLVSAEQGCAPCEDKEC